MVEHPTVEVVVIGLSQVQSLVGGFFCFVVRVDLISRKVSSIEHNSCFGKGVVNLNWSYENFLMSDDQIDNTGF